MPSTAASVWRAIGRSIDWVYGVNECICAVEIIIPSLEPGLETRHLFPRE
jgi:hypothetical protein